MISCSDYKKQKKRLFDTRVSDMKALGFTDREAHIDARSVQLPADTEFKARAKEFGVTPEEMRAEWLDIGKKMDEIMKEREQADSEDE